MDAFQTFSSTLTTIPIIVIYMLSPERLKSRLPEALASWSGGHTAEILSLCDCYGAPLTLAAISISPYAVGAVFSIGKVLAGTPDDAKDFKQSFSSNLNMTAVAAAIIAQIAITGLSLDGIDDVHWTAAAFFVASIMMGVISVYASFVVQIALNGLIGAKEVRDWLSINDTQRSRPRILRGARRQGNGTRGASGGLCEEQPGVASLAAAMMLTSPANTLNAALLALIVGFGVYLGCIYSENLRPGLGTGGMRGILIFFIGSTVIGLYQYSLPSLVKTVEGLAFDIAGKIRRVRALRTRRDPDLQTDPDGAVVVEMTPSHRHTARNLELGPQTFAPVGSVDGIDVGDFRAALAAYLDAQEESMRMGRALLDVCSRMPPASE